MGSLEVWWGPAGCGKTGKALHALREELAQEWRGVRYLVPTVGHKRSIEQLLLTRGERPGLLGDPITTFFNFAEEVAARAGIAGHALTEVQKHLLLREFITTTPLTYFADAARYPGFVVALREIIDELKVHMIRPETVVAAGDRARTDGAHDLGMKLRELGILYQLYQQRVTQEHLYDNEGIMWIAAEALRHRPELFRDLRCLILDGFARLTPIQLDFLRALAPQVARVIVLFDYEEGRSIAYHPVEESLQRMESHARTDGFPLLQVPFAGCPARGTALEFVRGALFRDRKATSAADGSLHLFIAATAAHEAEMIARDLREILRNRRLPDGTPITPAEVAILARDPKRVEERLASAFVKYGLTLRREPPVLAHTPVGRMLLTVFRLLRDDWERDDVLALLKSGFLPIDPALAFEIDITARRQYLRNRRATWFDHWPEEDTREALQQAFKPLETVEEAYRQPEARTLLEAVAEMLRAFRERATGGGVPLPDQDSEAARRYTELEAAFQQTQEVLTHLSGLGNLLGQVPRDEMLTFLTTTLLRARLHLPGANTEGIALYPVHATGGQKFRLVYLCDLLQGAFPRHQRESAFLLDHEREETLKPLDIPLEMRRHLEDDEQYWFLHALASATDRVVVSYPCYEANGQPLEYSPFIDELVRLLPNITDKEHATTTSFRDHIPQLDAAQTKEEYLAALALGLRTARQPEQHPVLAAAYAGCPFTQGPSSLLAAMIHRVQPAPPTLADPAITGALQARMRAYSASEIQAYCDCPFLWFAQYPLAVEEISEEYSFLDRGIIVHNVLEQLYRRHQQRAGAPVNLSGMTLEALWPSVEADLRVELERQPRYRNRAAFIREIEWEALCRMMRRFLHAELRRAALRLAHPAFFEHYFGSAGKPGLVLKDPTIVLQGKIDRIDLRDDDPTQAVVIDYKASASMTQKSIIAGEVLQAPVYLLALQRVLGRTPVGMEFMGIKQGKGVGVFTPAIAEVYPGEKATTLDLPAWQTLLDDAETHMCAAVAAMRQGAIDLDPTTPRCPDCPHIALCRGNRFALARKVRENRRARVAAEA